DLADVTREVVRVGLERTDRQPRRRVEQLRAAGGALEQAAVDVEGDRAGGGGAGEGRDVGAAVVEAQARVGERVGAAGAGKDPALAVERQAEVVGHSGDFAVHQTRAVKPGRPAADPLWRAEHDDDREIAGDRAGEGQL